MLNKLLFPAFNKLPNPIKKIPGIRSVIASGNSGMTTESTETVEETTTNMTPSVLDSVPKVDIDPSGVFKYILLKVYESSANDEPNVIIVRGYSFCAYHSDIFDEVHQKIAPLDCDPIGGGRISHDPDRKKLHIYGYSQGYGKANHEVTAKLLKDAYPDYTITISDEGY